MTTTQQLYIYFNVSLYRDILTNNHTALQRQSTVTTHLVKNELRLVMGFMTCVVSACVCLVKKYLG